MVQRLKVLCPSMGRKRIANVLARAGLHLSASSVRRMLRRHLEPEPGEQPAPAVSARTVSAKYPGHVWNVDLTAVPTRLGFWVPWLPHALTQRFPFCWWVMIILDHFSRRVVGFAIFPKQPTSGEVCTALDRAAARSGAPPKYTVTDNEVQFGGIFLEWCDRHGVRPRFGAVGKYGSIAIIERFMRTLKSEGFRRFIVPMRLDAMCAATSRTVRWYNEYRPHEALGGATPREVYDGSKPANQTPRLEPRWRYPDESPCAAPRVAIGRRVSVGELRIRSFEGEQHLPIVELRDAA